MKLIRFGEPGRERPGIIAENGSLWDVSSRFGDYDAHFFASGGMRLIRAYTDEGMPGATPVSQGSRLGPPVAMPSKIVCAGLNYRAHSNEFAHSQPTEPALFLKAPSALAGPDDVIIRPPDSEKLDYEVELAIVIGKRASHIDLVEAGEYIAGYTLMCDVSERAMQLEHGGQWTKGKSYDSFAPLGPCLVSPEGFPPADKLHLWLKVNGEIRQSDFASSMIWSVPQLISYASRFMTLLPGDILSTGSPSGVAMGREGENAYLKDGDTVEMGCEPIGQCRHRVVRRQDI